MLRSFLDHIVVTAPSLEAGVRYVHRVLGVPLETGGRHMRMGTHNCLLRLGREQYLEVIAVDPQARAPHRPRWFELDRTAAPRLAGWVARVGDIQEASTAGSQALGVIETMSRGDLAWRITIPEDGGLPFHGIAPMLIQWSGDQHPAHHLRDQGCSLIGLEGFHPQAGRISNLLESIGFQDRFEISRQEAPHLVAYLKTPVGICRMSTQGDPNG